MNRSQAKGMLPFIQALAEGKPIQLKDRLGNWMDVDFINVELCSPNVYRIKPEPKYRPFANAEECWAEMQKHQPFGYIIDKTTKLFSNIGILDNRGILTLCTQYSCSLKESFNRYTFADGTPFGIKEGADD